MENWGAWLARALGALPYIVSGIEQMHGEAKSGAEKKQIAMEALGLAYGTATTFLPEQKAAIDAATSLASVAIDGVKTMYNVTRQSPVHPTSPLPTGAPAQAATSAQ
jgi:uncharacterized membrane protein YphA (DoxX/SURF4 family)